MRKFYFLVVGLLVFSGVTAQIVTIPDAGFKATLLRSDLNNEIARDLSQNYFKIDANNDGEIQVSEAQNVLILNVRYASISSLVGISSFSNLTYLYCENNQLTSLDVSALVNLRGLFCSSNQLTSINLSKPHKLESLRCDDNNLSSLIIKNTNVITYNIDFSNNINIQYICANERQLRDVQNLINEYGYTNCHVNTYCSFVSGGDYYTIQGNIKLDNNNNGCDI